MRITSLPPVLAPCPPLLILGSIPGRRSLELGQYYAHPRNAFWRILGQICGFEPELPYPARLERLKASGISLWDSIQSCERTGSLDSLIAPKSEVPNDIPALLSRQATIRTLAFNGLKSWLAFENRILPALSPDLARRLSFLRLPSTSPANTRFSYAQLLSAWEEIREYL